MYRRCVLGLLASVLAVPALCETVMTSASNVRLRSAAAADAPVVTELPLGSQLEIAAIQRTGDWVAVQIPGAGGDTAWVNGLLVVPVNADTWPQVVRRLIAGRLARAGDGFAARVQLLDLIESVQQGSWDHEAAARLELQRLRALQAVLYSIPLQGARSDPHIAGWVAHRAQQIRYNEPGGHWLIRNEVILAAHDAFPGTASADDMAWMAVEIGLAGECEGHIVCYLEWTDRLQGEYLRRQPAGRHVEAAVGRLIDLIGRAFATDAIAHQYYFDPQQECDAMIAVTRALDAAVRSSQATQREMVSAKLADLQALCR